jgi:hypothetical protein
MPRVLAHAAAKRELVAVERPIDWGPPQHPATARGVD